MTGRAWLLGAAVALGCATSSNSDPTPTKVSDAAPRMTMAIPTSCLEIRRCQHVCKGEKACESTCVTSAPVAAQAKSKAVDLCVAKACPKPDVSCRCTAECMMPSDCADLLDECTDGLEDPICAAYCRSG